MSTNINSWLREATFALDKAGIESSKLDAEIILAHTIKQPRTFLHAHGNDEISDRDAEIATARLSLRLDRTPVAYIIGHKEFYGRQFKVTTATLIPRPESEDIIDIAKKIILDDRELPSDAKIVDVGTGSGCLGITLKLELPSSDVTIIDISQQALNIAEQNAKQLGANVRPLIGDLLSNYPMKPDMIVANLPYVDPTWDVSPELAYEPQIALFARDGGLALIKKLIEQASRLLSSHGVLILEADPRQHRQILSLTLINGFSPLTQNGYCLAFRRD